jgi:hypothetical protein
MLDDLKHASVGANGSVFGGGAHGSDADFFNLDGNDVATAGEIGGGFGVVEGRGEAAIDDEARGA